MKISCPQPQGITHPSSCVHDFFLESCFSLIDRVIVEPRRRLAPDTVEMLTCIKAQELSKGNSEQLVRPVMPPRLLFHSNTALTFQLLLLSLLGFRHSSELQWYRQGSKIARPSHHTMTQSYAKSKRWHTCSQYDRKHKASRPQAAFPEKDPDAGGAMLHTPYGRCTCTCRLYVRSYAYRRRHPCRTDAPYSVHTAGRQLRRRAQYAYRNKQSRHCIWFVPGVSWAADASENKIDQETFKPMHMRPRSNNCHRATR